MKVMERVMVVLSGESQSLIHQVIYSVKTSAHSCALVFFVY